MKTEVKKFMFTLNKILDRELELEADGELGDLNEDTDIPPETLLNKPLISTFCYEVAKVKATGSLNEVNKPRRNGFGCRGPKNTRKLVSKLRTSHILKQLYAVPAPEIRKYYA